MTSRESSQTISGASPSAPTVREAWERKARWNGFGEPRIWLTDFNREDEAETEITVAYVWHPGSPDTYDASRGGPGGWDPGYPAEVEIYAAFTDLAEVELAAGERERITLWLTENPPEDDEPDWERD